MVYEKQRESRDNYIPEIFPLEQNVIEVDSETKDMLKNDGFPKHPRTSIGCWSKLPHLNDVCSVL